MNHKVIAVIPARGGSKRIPRKNIRDFCGKPMIAWSIEAAKDCHVFDHIIVSTDDAEIAEVAKSFGAEVPFLRPKELSDDHTATRPVVNHAIQILEGLYGRPDHVCCIYATAPFIRAEDLKSGLKKLIESGSNFAFSVTSFAYPIQRAIKISEDGQVSMFNPEYRNAQSQDLEEAYHDAGQFYWGKAEAFLDNLPTFSGHAVPVVLPRYRVQDIDTMEDWKRAELMFRAARTKED
jgi:N-acylneuraminate cytidylyltransferase